VQLIQQQDFLREERRRLRTTLERLEQRRTALKTIEGQGISAERATASSRPLEPTVRINVSGSPVSPSW
jgi:hypothetical protein